MDDDWNKVNTDAGSFADTGLQAMTEMFKKVSEQKDQPDSLPVLYLTKGQYDKVMKFFRERDKVLNHHKE